MKTKPPFPNPGSAEAVKRGCQCPVLDNHHGKGVNGMFWVTEDCPLHRSLPAPEIEQNHSKP